MVSHRIKDARKMRGLNQKGLADLIGVSLDTISRWENNIREPRISDIKSISEALNVSIAFLMGEEEKNSQVQAQQPTSLDNMLNELVNIAPALVARFRSTGENWSRFSDEEKQALIDGLNFVLGRSVSPRLKMIGKDEGI
ncbi:MAG: helix-turn-helix domain-containing protein [Cloacibacillus porcorum]|uniref:helix-turn-helix domain-containing protein n=1 Tax=Cloacibacillus porcorum TaxID=1197717 RepID=UPI0023EF6726|nr:helix-turn-helix transcriptional regulator [Cloacibacillus porcorum]MCD7875388.1 helix-turn-helix domain-containing protein [Cloacibacillus porcorum]